MRTNLIKASVVFAAVLLVCACSVAKLEARLEANPQCKDVINPKTGALMPCPGSDKAFYREVGLAPANPSAATTGAVKPLTSATSENPVIQSGAALSAPKSIPAQPDCKPQIHKKTGGTLPCPPPD